MEGLSRTMKKGAGAPHAHSLLPPLAWWRSGLRCCQAVLMVLLARADVRSLRWSLLRSLPSEDLLKLRRLRWSSESLSNSLS